MGRAAQGKEPFSTAPSLEEAPNTPAIFRRIKKRGIVRRY